MHLRMKVVIGIVTHQRQRYLLGLLSQLSTQLGENDVIFVRENGHPELTKSQLQKIHPHILLFQTDTASIPNSRNFLFNQAKKMKADYLIFLDDDVLVTSKWLDEAKFALKQTTQQHAQILQGNYRSIPRKNLYAQTTDQLSKMWLKVNQLPNSLTRIMDTKHLGFVMKDFLGQQPLFDENQKYASDIMAGANLITRKGFKIYFAENLVVYHRERTSWLTFVRHRFRISTSFRTVATKYPDFFQSVSFPQKMVILWKNVKFGWVSKIWIILNLITIYFFVVVSNSITSLRRR